VLETRFGFTRHLKKYNIQTISDLLILLNLLYFTSQV
jgi:hypothetical protein